jgi:YidC/Oxa1 family membrane protein insertase
MALYRRAGVNPASGCLPLLIQLPILIALYRVFFIGLSPETFHLLYPFVDPPAAAQLSFLGISLTQPSLRLAILAGVSQFVLMRQATPGVNQNQLPAGNDQSAQMMASMQKNMAYIFPAMTVFVSLQLPAALALYWVASTLFGIVQQYLFKKYLKVESNVAV